MTARAFLRALDPNADAFAFQLERGRRAYFMACRKARLRIMIVARRIRCRQRDRR